MGATNVGRQWVDFDTAGGNANQIVDVPNTEHHSGMWAQTRSVTQSNVGVNAESSGRFNRGWLDMSCVDPCQTTQAYTIKSTTMQDDNVSWRGTHSGRMQTKRVDVDEYVEPGQDNVDVGLSLHGQFIENTNQSCMLVPFKAHECSIRSPLKA